MNTPFDFMSTPYLYMNACFLKMRVVFFMRGTRKARGIEAEPPAKVRSTKAGDVADSPTRAKRSGSPYKFCFAKFKLKIKN
jgi:hypothetical protein